MNKPTLTAEQAKAFEALKDVWKHKWETGKHTLIKEKINGGWKGHFGDAESISNDDFIRALYVGYEIEKTPEEKVAEYYRSVYAEWSVTDDRTWRDGYYEGSYDAISTVLGLLGIKIEGVNA